MPRIHVTTTPVPTADARAIQDRCREMHRQAVLGGPTAIDLADLEERFEVSEDVEIDWPQEVLDAVAAANEAIQRFDSGIVYPTKFRVELSPQQRVEFLVALGGDS